MSSPKRHHFLPRFYLSGFGRGDYVAVFERASGEYRVQPIKDTAVIKHYYSAEDAEGKKDPAIEKALSELESGASAIIRKLDNRERLSVDDRYTLALFVGFLYARVPEYEATVNHVHEGLLRHILRSMYPNEEATQERHGRELEQRGVTAKDIVEHVHGDHYEVATHRNSSLRMMLDTAPHLARLFADMNWAIVHPESDKHAFVVTDSPVCLYPPRNHNPNGFRGVGMTSKGALKVVPLSHQTCLVIADFDEQPSTWELKATRDQVRATNMNNVLKCQNYVIGRDEALVRNLVTRSGVDKTNWEPKVRVG